MRGRHAGAGRPLTEDSLHVTPGERSSMWYVEGSSVPKAGNCEYTAQEQQLLTGSKRYYELDPQDIWEVESRSAKDSGEQYYSPHCPFQSSCDSSFRNPFADHAEEQTSWDEQYITYSVRSQMDLDELVTLSQNVDVDARSRPQRSENMPVRLQKQQNQERNQRQCANRITIGDGGRISTTEHNNDFEALYAALTRIKTQLMESQQERNILKNQIVFLKSDLEHYRCIASSTAESKSNQDDKVEQMANELSNQKINAVKVENKLAESVRQMEQLRAERDRIHLKFKNEKVELIKKRDELENRLKETKAKLGLLKKEKEKLRFVNQQNIELEHQIALMRQQNEVNAASQWPYLHCAPQGFSAKSRKLPTKERKELRVQETLPRGFSLVSKRSFVPYNDRISPVQRDTQLQAEQPQWFSMMGRNDKDILEELFAQADKKFSGNREAIQSFIESKYGLGSLQCAELYNYFMRSNFVYNPGRPSTRINDSTKNNLRTQSSIAVMPFLVKNAGPVRYDGPLRGRANTFWFKMQNPHLKGQIEAAEVRVFTLTQTPPDTSPEPMESPKKKRSD